MGGVVGAVGSVFKLSNAAQAGIQLVAAIFMVLMALNLLDIGGLRGVVPTLPAGLRTKLMGKVSRSSLYLGLLNGLMPCGPLQAMQLYALSTGSWHMGALSMFCFCLGTVPLMLGFGLVSGRLNKRFARPMRVASGALVLLMGMAMLSNGLSLWRVVEAIGGSCIRGFSGRRRNGNTLFARGTEQFFSRRGQILSRAVIGKFCMQCI